jgi:hypothetical protein
MSSSKSQALATIKAFDGTDYLLWSKQMEAFLQFSGVWRVVNGTRKCPPSGTMAADFQAIAAWEDNNDLAQGAIKMCLASNLHHHVKATSALTWVALSTQYAQTGISAVYANFQKALRIKLSGTQNPTVEIERLFTLFE